MKCIECGSALTTKRENVQYTALPGTVLVGVEVNRCPNCGEYEVSIPAIDELNKMIATDVINKKERLNGAEIRFLRSYLGYSGADFAKLIGSSPATVSRWESDSQDIGHHADLLLRTMIALDKKVEEYPIASLADVGEMKVDKGAKKKPQRGFTNAAKKWKATELRA